MCKREAVKSAVNIWRIKMNLPMEMTDLELDQFLEFLERTPDMASMPVTPIAAIIAAGYVLEQKGYKTPEQSNANVFIMAFHTGLLCALIMEDKLTRKGKTVEDVSMMILEKMPENNEVEVEMKKFYSLHRETSLLVAEIMAVA